MLTRSLLFLFASFTLVTSQQCNDIDTGACKLLLVQRPDLCSDPVLAKSTCPRFCKLCPVECYHCNATVLDYHLCNTTKLCAENEVCMKKELKSFVDGHHEYEMTCAAKQICDGGSDLVIPFGKRDIESRDISVTCCADDLCNYPKIIATTSKPSSTSTGCDKDIVFLVDETSAVVSTQQQAVIQTIIDVVKKLDIGVQNNLVGLYGYGDNLDPKFDLQQNTDKLSLLTALQSQQFRTKDRTSDIHDAIHGLTHHALQPGSGDRSNYPDAVVLISDSAIAGHVHGMLRDRSDLQKASHDVIIVSVGTRFQSLNGHNLETLATDQNHIIHVNDMYTSTNLVDSIVALLKIC